MSKSIIVNYPYPLDKIINNVIDFIVVYFNEVGEIIDYNEVFDTAYQISDDQLKLLNINDLIIIKNRDSFSLNFDKDEKEKRFLIELNEKYTRNPINNSYDGRVYKIEEIYCLIGKKNLHDSDEIMNNMSLLTNQLSNLSRDLSKKNIELKKANERIENLLRIDKLTGLSNRRHFMEFIQKEMATANRYQNPLTLVMCDIDNFKAVNDTFGHDAGDRVLKTVGNLIANEIRKGELAARIGGDEFAIILTQTSLEKGKIFAERLQSSIRKINLDKVINSITFSIGITELKLDESFATFYKRTDIAMYEAKKSGKNKVFSLE